MKKIVVIGNSLAAANAIEALRKKDSSSEITLIVTEECLPYNRFLLGSLINNEMSGSQVLCRPLEKYEELNVKLVMGKKLGRINFKKNRIFLEDKETIDYNFLIISGMGSYEFSGVKGMHRAGTYCLTKLIDVQQALKTLPLIETVIVQSESPAGLKMACALRGRDKEVIVIHSGKHILPLLIDEESGIFIQNLLEEKGLRIIAENEIIELLGDAEVKAVKLKTGKVIASQVVFFGELSDDLKLFKDSDLLREGGLCVNVSFQTKNENIFAVDGVCDFLAENQGDRYDSYVSALEQQGEIVASAINRCIENTAEETAAGAGDEAVLLNLPVKRSTIVLDDLRISLIGETVGAEEVHSFLRADEDIKQYKKIFIQNFRVIGAILVNAEKEEEKISGLLTGKIDIEGLEEVILDVNSTYEQIIDAEREKPNFSTNQETTVAGFTVGEPSQSMSQMSPEGSKLS